MSSIDSWLPLVEVLPIAEHAMAATEHSRSPYIEPVDALAVPSLI
ncbi:hypothetical protein [Nocardia sp. NPDC050710]